jgi:hypothetical protein
MFQTVRISDFDLLGLVTFDRCWFSDPASAFGFYFRWTRVSSRYIWQAYCRLGTIRAMLTTDRVSGSALVCFSLLVIWESRRLPFGTFRQPGPAYIPVILAIVLLLFGLCLIFASKRAPSISSIDWTEWRHAVAIFSASIFSVLAIERLGYRLTVLLVLGFLVKVVENRAWVLSLAFALALSFGSFFLFYTVLRVPLPEGPLGF